MLFIKKNYCQTIRQIVTNTKCYVELKTEKRILEMLHLLNYELATLNNKIYNTLFKNRKKNEIFIYVY